MVTSSCMVSLSRSRIMCICHYLLWQEIKEARNDTACTANANFDSSFRTLTSEVSFNNIQVYIYIYIFSQSLFGYVQP